MPRRYLKTHLTKGYLRKRIASPGAFIKSSFRTKTLDGGKKLIVGRKKSSGKWEAQAVLVPRKNSCVKGNPWYVVDRDGRVVGGVSEFPHFTKESADRELSYHPGIARYTDKAVKRGDYLHPDGSVRKTPAKWQKNPWYLTDRDGVILSSERYETINEAREASNLWGAKTGQFPRLGFVEDWTGKVGDKIDFYGTYSQLKKKNPWYVVAKPNLRVVSAFPHFTKESAQDEQDSYADSYVGTEVLHTDHAVVPGDLIARDGRVVTRKKLGLENPTMKGKSHMWFPKKGSEAAKDIGSLLQKMRGTTGAEKEALRKKFKEVRAKWMARDAGARGSKKNPLAEAVASGVAAGATMSLLKGNPRGRNPHLIVVGNPPKNGLKVPKRLEKAIMKAPAGDRPELMKGLEKYYEFHGCFPPKIVKRNVDHAKMGLPLVNVGLGRSDRVEYRSTNKASNKFFAGGKGRYVHKFGDELPKAQRDGAKPLLVTDPEGKTLHYLPSRFRVKDWIHH